MRKLYAKILLLSLLVLTNFKNLFIKTVIYAEMIPTSGDSPADYTPVSFQDAILGFFLMTILPIVIIMILLVWFYSYLRDKRSKKNIISDKLPKI